MKKTSRRKTRHLNLVRQAEAARTIGCHRNTVLAMYSRDELRGEWIDGTLFLNRSDVEREAKKRTAEAAVA